MHLGQGLFEDITGGIDLSNRSSDDERRIWPRVPIGLRGTIQMQEGPLGARPVTVMVRDISRQGIGLLCADQLTPGKAFQLKLQVKDDDAVSLSCIVTRCERGGLGESHFVLGANFRNLSDADTKTSSMN